MHLAPAFSCRELRWMTTSVKREGRRSMPGWDALRADEKKGSAIKLLGAGGRCWGGSSRRQVSADQRALPDSKEQFLELREVLGPKLSAPFALDVAENVMDL